MTKPVPVRRNCWDQGRPNFENTEKESAAAASEIKGAHQSAFQAKLEEMEKQRADIAKASNDFKAEVNARAESQANEMNALLSNLQALQDLVAKNQEEANERMKNASDNFAAFQKDMLKAAAEAATQRMADQAQRAQDQA